MSDSENDDIKFRDQCALHIFQALVLRKDVNSMVNGLIENIGNPKNQDYVDYCLQKAEVCARISYKLADIMRKARIASFK